MTVPGCSPWPTLAGADGGIRAWNSKKHYNFWRPITAIRQLLPEDNDGNPLTDADATWTPLSPTPPYPDYTSGANNLAGSFDHRLALLPCRQGDVQGHDDRRAGRSE